ncbi:MAG TPA: hypothetical protein VKE22_19265, partial [Haliangiales bacterium]|nr:hypothetical protein [Haliangiales bacterium]
LPLFRRAEPPPSPQATTGVEEKLLALDPDRMTPMEALGALAQLRRLIQQMEPPSATFPS